ncbi:MAG: M48 family metallopeptidase [Candidatus Acidiferrum sp.]
MRTRILTSARFALLVGLAFTFNPRAGGAQSNSASTALPADLPKANLPSHPPAIQSVNGETYATFDADAATEAYLAKIPAAQRAASNAYFEGGYWLILWDFLLSAAVFLFLLSAGVSWRMRALAERLTGLKPLQSILYGLQFVLVLFVLTSPMSIYEGYYREHKYGLLNQTFAPWFKEQLIGLALSLIATPLFIALVMGIVRKVGRNWWVWAAAASIAVILFIQLIAPVYVLPLFNTYTKLENATVRDAILSLARANGIPATDVYEVDASRQSNRVSANVSGFLGTQRITLNDNLLRRCSMAEIEVVMGHEMGHYVLNHSYKFALFLGLVALLMFAFLNWALRTCLGRWGEGWKVREIGDVAVLPLAALLLALFSFVFTPVLNSAVRTQEFEADVFGLNAAEQPDGEAEVDLKLGEYRKMSPTPLEEIIFFDHPSGRTRIATAMRWKKEHLPGSPLVTVPAGR